MKSKLSTALFSFLAFYSFTLHAAVVGFSINTSVTQGGNSLDFAAMNFSIPVGTSITLDPGNSGTFLDVAIADGGTFSVIDAAFSPPSVPAAKPFMELFAAGDSIDSNSYRASPGQGGNAWSLYNNQVDAGWVSSFSNGFIGFKTNSDHFGYVEVNWTYDPGTELGTLEFLTGAVEDVANTAIIVQSSTVPVPAAAWLFGSGLIGMIGVARRRVM